MQSYSSENTELEMSIIDTMCRPSTHWLVRLLVSFFLLFFRYMEEVIESTFSLLTLCHDHGSTSPGTEKTLEPSYLLALLDIKATWFKKWMVRISEQNRHFGFAQKGSLYWIHTSLHQHGFYSRTVVLRLLERKYKSLVSDSPKNQYPSLTPLYFRNALKSPFQRATEPTSTLRLHRAR